MLSRVSNCPGRRGDNISRWAQRDDKQIGTSGYIKTQISFSRPMEGEKKAGVSTINGPGDFNVAYCVQWGRWLNP